MAVTRAVGSATPSRAVSERLLFAATLAGFVIWDTLGGPICQQSSSVPSSAMASGSQWGAERLLMATIGGGMAWTTPLWAGAPVLAGIYGLVASLFAIPPRFASADDV